MKAEEYRTDIQEVSGVKVEIHSYRLDDTFYCHVANVDVGAIIARGSGATRQEAVASAMGKVQERLR